MNGLHEIKTANATAPKNDYRVQRDRLAQCLRKCLKGEVGANDAAAKLLTEIFGK
jgi:hypothetical protein